MQNCCRMSMLRKRVVRQLFQATVMLLMATSNTFAQDSSKPVQKTIVGTSVADTLRQDTTRVVEDAALDIAQNRGLFIVTPDRKMQLRILGSVRYLVKFDNIELTSINTYNTYEIPTGANRKKLPNYFNGLTQTRLGFEVTRKTGKGDVFVRLETDFAGANGYRIRHAYGQFGRLLFGQTWSLFTHVSALPATVDFGGPTGSVGVRTPQIRYSVPKTIGKGYYLSFGLEYVVPKIDLPDSVLVQTFQLLPAATVRLDRKTPWGSIFISGIMPMLTARGQNDKFIIKPGWGVAASAVINSWKQGTWYFQVVGGRAISDFLNNLDNAGLDVILSPENKARSPFTFGTFATYEHSWNKNFFSNFTYSIASVEKLDFTSGDFFRSASTFRANSFWNVVDGARLGGEVIWGVRHDKDSQLGRAMRINLLMYYDF